MSTDMIIGTVIFYLLAGVIYAHHRATKRYEAALKSAYDLIAKAKEPPVLPSRQERTP